MPYEHTKNLDHRRHFIPSVRVDLSQRFSEYRREQKKKRRNLLNQGIDERISGLKVSYGLDGKKDRMEKYGLGRKDRMEKYGLDGKKDRIEKYGLDDGRRDRMETLDDVQSEDTKKGWGSGRNSVEDRLRKELQSAMKGVKQFRDELGNRPPLDSPHTYSISMGENELQMKLRNQKGQESDEERKGNYGTNLKYALNDKTKSKYGLSVRKKSVDNSDQIMNSSSNPSTSLSNAVASDIEKDPNFQEEEEKLLQEYHHVIDSNWKHLKGQANTQQDNHVQNSYQEEETVSHKYKNLTIDVESKQPKKIEKSTEIVIQQYDYSKNDDNHSEESIVSNNESNESINEKSSSPSHQQRMLEQTRKVLHQKLITPTKNQQSALQEIQQLLQSHRHQIPSPLLAHVEKLIQFHQEIDERKANLTTIKAGLLIERNVYQAKCETIQEVIQKDPKWWNQNLTNVL